MLTLRELAEAAHTAPLKSPCACRAVAWLWCAAALPIGIKTANPWTLRTLETVRLPLEAWTGVERWLHSRAVRWPDMAVLPCGSQALWSTRLGCGVWNADGEWRPAVYDAVRLGALGRASRLLGIHVSTAMVRGVAADLPTMGREDAWALGSRPWARLAALAMREPKRIRNRTTADAWHNRVAVIRAARV